MNLVTAHVGVFLGQQAVQGPFDKIGVAGETVAVGIGDFLGFDHEVNCVGRVGSHGRKVVAADDVEHLEQQESLRRRGGLVDTVATVFGADGFANIGVMIVEIGDGECSAKVVEPSYHLLGQGAAIESIGATLGDGADGCSEVLVDQHVAFAWWPSAGEVNISGGAEPRQKLGAVGKDSGDTGRNREAVLGVSDGGFQQVGEGQGAEIAMERFPGGHLTGNGYRVGAGNGHQVESLLAVVAGLGARRGGSAAIDVGYLARGCLVGQDERVAAEATHGNDGYTFYGGNRQGSVEGVAAVLQDSQSGSGGQRRI